MEGLGRILNEAKGTIMSDFYILDNRKAVRADLMAWGQMMQDPASKRVAETTIGDVRVSTVFLGLDHAFGGGPPMLFETMAFGGPLDKDQDRCSTWEEAEAMHEAMCKRVSAAAL
jgi:hypothetical protein